MRSLTFSAGRPNLFRQILCICQAKTLDLCTETFAYGIFFVFCARFRGDEG